MISIIGELTVRTINGRNGPFNVGRLSTSIGEFVIKDSQLDQFNEGKFSGYFIIQEIRPASYFANGRLVVEVRARVSDMQFDDEVLGDLPEEFPDMDPMEEEATTEASVLSKESKPQKTQEAGAGAESPQFGYSSSSKQSEHVTTTAQHRADHGHITSEAEHDELLFGMLWPLGVHVKLDPTVDRAVLRKQCSRLNELGYEFKCKSQTWEKMSNQVSLVE